MFLRHVCFSLSFDITIIDVHVVCLSEWILSENTPKHSKVWGERGGGGVWGWKGQELKHILKKKIRAYLLSRVYLLSW